jgi:hypothetical protein
MNELNIFNTYVLVEELEDYTNLRTAILDYNLPNYIEEESICKRFMFPVCILQFSITEEEFGFVGQTTLRTSNTRVTVDEFIQLIKDFWKIPF